jgi:hypothetical protein
MQVLYSKRADLTPAFALIAEGWNDLVQSGLSPEGRGYCPVKPSTEVFYAEREDKEIVGVLCFDRDGDRWQVCLAYVEPTSRKQGAFRSMWKSLVAFATKQEAASIILSQHVDNEAMEAVMAKIGLQPAAITYEAILAA